jgi:hypothetical protein
MDCLKLRFIVLTFALYVLANSETSWADVCRVGDCRNGFGVEEHTSGDWIYEGTFFRGKRTGKGKITWANGTVYEGDWVEGERTGKGKYTWATGNVYEGDWVKRKATGKGKITWANGDVYEGDWVESERTGKGKITWATGNVYEGDWVEGERTGNGKYTWPSGSVYEGDWVDSQRMGKGKYTSASGSTETQYWLNGEQITKKAWAVHLKEEEAKLERQAEIDRAREKRWRIYDACIVDKSKGLEKASASVKSSVRSLCNAIADDPSWLESIKYD